LKLGEELALTALLTEGIVVGASLLVALGGSDNVGSELGTELASALGALLTEGTVLGASLDVVLG
jgi:hypothetical protein